MTSKQIRHSFTLGLGTFQSPLRPTLSPRLPVNGYQPGTELQRKEFESTVTTPYAQ